MKALINYIKDKLLSKQHGTTKASTTDNTNPTNTPTEYNTQTQPHPPTPIDGLEYTFESGM